MIDIAKRTRKFGGPVFLSALAFAAAALFTCEKVPDYCGDGAIYDPSCEFCYGNKAYSACKNGTYSPLTKGCDAQDLIGPLCADGSVVPLGTPCGGYTVSAAVTPLSVGGEIKFSPKRSSYAAGDTVILSVDDDDDGYEFVGWAGAGTSALPYVPIAMSGMSANKPVVAMFKRKDAPSAGTYRLVTTAFPQYGGSVTRVPNDTAYNPGAPVKATARANPGYEFAGWAGASASEKDTVTVTMSESKTLVAVFTPKVYKNFKASVEGYADGGAVFVNGTALAAEDSRSVEADIVVFAKAADGYVFDGWSGAAAAAGKDNPARISVTGDGATVVATFRKRTGEDGARPPQQAAETYTMTLTGPNPAMGSVTLTPDLEKYGRGASVTAAATANAGYRFKAWSGTAVPSGAEAANPLIVVMDGNKTLSASFDENPGWDSDTAMPPPPPAATYTLTVNINPTAGGRVEVAGSGYASQVTVTGGTAVGISAIAADGYTFNGWTVTAGSARINNKDSANATVSLGADAAITADFKRSSTGGGTGGTGSFSYGGRTYTTVTIGGLTWMAENLNVQTEESWCHGEDGRTYEVSGGNVIWTDPPFDPEKCAKYGRYYTWEAAKSACQLIGWRLPSRDDWDNLGESVGGSMNLWGNGQYTVWGGAGKVLKATNGWREVSGTDDFYTGTNDYGFSALPTGMRSTDYDGCYNIDNGSWARWWTDAETSDVTAYIRFFAYDSNDLNELAQTNNKGMGFSVRCVK